jgi:apoptosis-inducing factor 2
MEYATDIAEVFPQKRVTLLHSRHQLLPRFSESMHEESERIFLFRKALLTFT